MNTYNILAIALAWLWVPFSLDGGYQLLSVHPAKTPRMMMQDSR